MSPSANPPEKSPGGTAPDQKPRHRVTALARGARRGLGRTLGRVLAGLLTALTLVASVETVAWTFFDHSWAAAQEIQALLLIWLALLGAAWGVVERFHIAVTLLADRLPPAGRRGISRLATALTATFGVLLMVHGAELTTRIRNTLPGTGWPAAVQYLPVAVGGALIALLALADLFTDDAPEPPTTPRGRTGG